MLDVLVIAPHPDDAELGMGGAICRLLAEGLRVGVLDLTNGEPTPHGSPEMRAREPAADNPISLRAATAGLSRFPRRAGLLENRLAPSGVTSVCLNPKNGTG